MEQRCPNVKSHERGTSAACVRFYGQMRARPATVPPESPLAHSGRLVVNDRLREAALPGARPT